MGLDAGFRCAVVGIVNAFLRVEPHILALGGRRDLPYIDR